MPSGQVTTPAEETGTAITVDDRCMNDTDVLHTGWEWSESFTSFIDDRTQGRSLKICAGTKPVADVNLDALPMKEVAEKNEELAFSVENGVVVPDEDAHDAVGGRMIQGDMYDVPFPDGAFDTVIADWPWREMDKQERVQMFEEAKRVTAVGGRLLLNATWIPGVTADGDGEGPRIRHDDTRMRQQRDFWGCPSFIVLHRRTPTETELLDHYEFSVDTHSDAVTASRFVHAETMTNPRAVDPTDGEYSCPKCDTARLAQLGETTNPHDPYECDLYECMACGFRATEDEVEPDNEECDAAQVTLGDVEAPEADVASGGVSGSVERRDGGGWVQSGRSGVGALD